MWDFIFRGKCNGTEQFALRCITEGGESNWVEEQNFPLVHRIIFGLSTKSLAAELDENPNAVYLTDAQNRTALDWATARAQLDDIALLLKYGADPNNMDITGRTPVLHAVDSHNTPCLRLILEGGGDPNPTMPKGVFRSSPLTAAGFAGMPELLKLLLDFDANPKASNPEGLTALHSVARTQNVECARLLLEYGADLNAISGSGVTPLSTAILHNNHAVLRLFVDQGYDYIATARLKGRFGLYSRENIHASLSYYLLDDCCIGRPVTDIPQIIRHQSSLDRCGARRRGDYPHSRLVASNEDLVQSQG